MASEQDQLPYNTEGPWAPGVVKKEVPYWVFKDLMDNISSKKKLDDLVGGPNNFEYKTNTAGDLLRQQPQIDPIESATKELNDQGYYQSDEKNESDFNVYDLHGNSDWNRGAKYTTDNPDIIKHETRLITKILDKFRNPPPLKEKYFDPSSDRIGHGRLQPPTKAVSEFSNEFQKYEYKNKFNYDSPVVKDMLLEVERQRQSKRDKLLKLKAENKRLEERLRKLQLPKRKMGKELKIDIY